MELLRDIHPAVELKHRVIGWRRGVERDVLLQRLLGGRHPRLVLPRRKERRRDQLDLGRRTAGLAGPLSDRGQNDLAGVAEARDRVQTQTIAQLARGARHVAVHRCEVDGNVRVLDRTRVEEGWKECELVVLALEILRVLSVLEGLPHRAQALDVLAHARARGRAPRRRVAPLVVRLHLRAQTESEASAGKALQIPCDLSRCHRAPRECNRDIRAEGDAPGVLRRNRKGEEGIVPCLGRGDAVESKCLGLPRGLRDGSDTDLRLALSRVLCRLRAKDHGLDSKRHDRLPERRRIDGAPLA